MKTQTLEPSTEIKKRRLLPIVFFIVATLMLLATYVLMRSGGNSQTEQEQAELLQPTDENLPNDELQDGTADEVLDEELETVPNLPTPEEEGETGL